MTGLDLAYIRGQRGSILIMVLWVIALLTMIAGYFSMEARLRGNMGYSAWNLLRSRIEVESILNLASLYVAPVDQKENEDKDQFLVADGSRYKVDIDGRQVEFRLEDERGKVDINKVSQEVLEKILDAVLQDQGKDTATHLADAIMDWRDNDDDRRPGGAEKDYYQSLSPAYKPSNSKFLLLEQLLLVKGMDPKIFWGPLDWEGPGSKKEGPIWKGGIQDLFTVYNQKGIVLKAAAPAPLLEILDEKDLSDAGGKGIMRLRTCLYQGCYQIFWEIEKQQNHFFKLLHWQQISRFD